MKLSITFIAIFLLNNLLFGQNDSMNSIYFNKQKILNLEKAGHISSLITRKDGIKQIHDVDLTEKIRVIVEFKDDPLFIAQKKNKLLKINSTLYTLQFSKFETDVNKLNSALAQNLKVDIAHPQIERKFYKTFYGVSLTIPRGIVNSIYSLGYVKIVHVDEKVKAFLFDSVPLIKADSVWKEFNT